MEIDYELTESRIIKHLNIYGLNLCIIDDIHKIKDTMFNKIILDACTNNNIDIITTLHKFKKINFDYDMFNIVCSEGYINLAKWIYTVDPSQLTMFRKELSENTIFYKELSPFYVSCSNGHIDLAKWIYQIDKSQLTIRSQNGSSPFYASCYNGHIDLAMWIYSIDPSQLYVFKCNGCSPFYASCYNGHINLAKWIYQIDKSQITIRNKNGCSPFYASCYSGHIDLAMWLYNIDPLQIRVNINNNCSPFYASCLEGHIDIVKWLYYIDPSQLLNVNDNNYTPLGSACYNNHIEVVRWICTIEPSQSYSHDIKSITHPFYVACCRNNFEIVSILYNIYVVYDNYIINNIIKNDLNINIIKLLHDILNKTDSHKLMLKEQELLEKDNIIENLMNQLAIKNSYVETNKSVDYERKRKILKVSH